MLASRQATWALPVILPALTTRWCALLLCESLWFLFSIERNK